MNSDDIELMAYVDGALAARRRAEVERMFDDDPDATRRVAWLGASRLPYVQAFAHQRLPPVPASLANTIDVMAHTARRRTDFTAFVDGRESANDAFAGKRCGTTWNWRRWIALAWFGAALGIAFVAGASVCRLVLCLAHAAN
ncbi:hypothetical protein GCT13_21435 [Paraburkholderia sp. CNPSo 3157]|uniref:Anti-sigma factor n=1 Tax=Paraburkholderia franconis TaxID=2654983 RepID=A0A7X1THB9_9BURK|nr:hypothetical protein [Paraburkholderia franconis]MPW19392.1 hypothetical protein [Paraburkholderia franconis]